MLISVQEYYPSQTLVQI